MTEVDNWLLAEFQARAISGEATAALQNNVSGFVRLALSPTQGGSVRPLCDCPMTALAMSGVLKAGNAARAVLVL